MRDTGFFTAEQWACLIEIAAITLTDSPESTFTLQELFDGAEDLCGHALCSKTFDMHLEASAVITKLDDGRYQLL